MSATHRTENWFVRFLGSVLSPSAKRMIFLSSLAAHLKNVNNPDRDLLEKLNELMSLSKDSSALRLPMLMQARIWDSFDVSEIKQLNAPVKTLAEVPGSRLSMAQLRILSIRIIRHIPKCLHYDSTEMMRQDIFKLVKNSQALPR